MLKDWRRFSDAFTREKQNKKITIESGGYQVDETIGGYSTTKYRQKTISLSRIQPNEEFEKYKRQLKEKVKKQRKLIKNNDRQARTKREGEISKLAEKFKKLYKPNYPIVPVANNENPHKLIQPLINFNYSREVSVPLHKHPEPGKWYHKRHSIAFGSGNPLSALLLK